jgi:hypothetical protein
LVHSPRVQHDRQATVEYSPALYSTAILCCTAAAALSCRISQCCHSDAYSTIGHSHLFSTRLCANTVSEHGTSFSHVPDLICTVQYDDAVPSLCSCCLERIHHPWYALYRSCLVYKSWLPRIPTLSNVPLLSSRAVPAVRICSSRWEVSDPDYAARRCSWDRGSACAESGMIIVVDGRESLSTHTCPLLVSLAHC